ncbi:cell wall-binding repeat-containing protein [Microbacterium saperdae]|uniref:Putative cell wall binding repeat protein n=1 Tax=Microbacterium saperdae TaxID=69368 RepID=A0A543BPE2_9MICO|nr:cell wall-binding repeat-containing protein [Microbacterium saperdae]TQL86658.1 putative cell wall binding repeat protein [Microbacterium saperdae]GGM46369.1 hypothetical protein GCM10010489_16930 [Microbacterium saperdae]
MRHRSHRRRRAAAAAIALSTLAVSAPLVAYASDGPSAAQHGSESATAAAPAPSIERLFGADRYETAAAVSADVFEAGTITAFVASGRDFPDALSAAPVSGLMNGPVLLTQPGWLPPATAREVAALKLDSVFVVGGPGAVSDTVLTQLDPLTAEGSFRMGGRNRYETAATMASWLKLEFPHVVYLASGDDYPDALTGAAAAGSAHDPVLLTGRDTLPVETAAALKRFAPSTVVALGGTGAVSDAVLDRAAAATGTQTGTDRFAGSTRYDTAVEVSRNTFAAGVPVVYIASGESFADALAGAAAGGSLGGPVLLTPPEEMPASAITELTRLAPARVIVLGGPTVVSETVVTQIEDALL